MCLYAQVIFSCSKEGEHAAWVGNPLEICTLQKAFNEGLTDQFCQAWMAHPYKSYVVDGQLCPACRVVELEKEPERQEEKKRREKKNDKIKAIKVKKVKKENRVGASRLPCPGVKVGGGGTESEKKSRIPKIPIPKKTGGASTTGVGTTPSRSTSAASFYSEKKAPRESPLQLPTSTKIPLPSRASSSASSCSEKAPPRSSLPMPSSSRETTPPSALPQTTTTTSKVVKEVVETLRSVEALKDDVDSNEEEEEEEEEDDDDSDTFSEIDLADIVVKNTNTPLPTEIAETTTTLQPEGPVEINNPADNMFSASTTIETGDDSASEQQREQEQGQPEEPRPPTVKVSDGGGDSMFRAFFSPKRKEIENDPKLRPFLLPGRIAKRELAAEVAYRASGRGAVEQQCSS